jgi:hypothetical protein
LIGENVERVLLLHSEGYKIDSFMDEQFIVTSNATSHSNALKKYNFCGVARQELMQLMMNG